MPVTVAELDRMAEAKAAALLASCCGSSRWVSYMLARRPFELRDLVLAAADTEWETLERDDWLEAFSHHPRIGEQVTAVPQGIREQAWSAQEQGGMRAASAEERAELAALNREYERRFGYIYIVCATGKSPEHLLALARKRLENSPEVELAVAAKEQQQIMHLRLEKLLA